MTLFPFCKNTENALSACRRIALLVVLTFATLAQAGSESIATMRLVTEVQDYFDACKTVEMRVVEYIYREKLAMNYQCDTFPWVRAQYMVKLGQRDAMVTIPTNERKIYAEPSILPVAVLNMRLFVWKSAGRYDYYRTIKTLDDLKEGVFVAQEGSGWAPKEIATRGIAIEWTKSIESVFRMLAIGRGDFTIQGDLYAIPVLNDIGLNEQIEIMPVIMEKSPYHLMVSRLSPHMATLPKFNAALNEISNNGVLKKLTDKFVQERYNSEARKAEKK